MKIGRSANWYRPYSITVNGKSYNTEKIHFYNEDSILVSSRSGWLENSNGIDITELDLPVEEIKLRRKVKFDGTVFAIVHKESYGNDTVADLYIPADMFNIHFVRNELQNHSAVYAIYEGLCGIYIQSYIKSINDGLYAIRNEYEEIYKKVNDSYLAINKSEETLANIDKLKELAEKFFEERKRLRGLTIEDIKLEN